MWNRFRNRNNPLRGLSFEAAFDNNRLTDAAMQELGQPASGGGLGVEPSVDSPAAIPMTERRMHGAELRPTLMNTWNQVRRAEHEVMSVESAAVSQGVIEMLAYLAGHLSSPEAAAHLSLVDLMGEVDIDTDVATRISLAHQVANPEDPNVGTV